MPSSVDDVNSLDSKNEVFYFLKKIWKKQQKSNKDNMHYYTNKRLKNIIDEQIRQYSMCNEHFRIVHKSVQYV